MAKFKWYSTFAALHIQKYNFINTTNFFFSFHCEKNVNKYFLLQFLLFTGLFVLTDFDFDVELDILEI